MKVLNRKRVALLCAGLGATGAVSAFSFGATSAQFTSNADPQNNVITAGTITLSSTAGGSAPLSIPVSGLVPGDVYCTPSSTSGNCPANPTGPGGIYNLVYTGSSPAFVGLDMHVTSSAPNPCPAAPAGTYNNSGASPTLASVVALCTGAGHLGQLPLFDGSAGSLDLTADERATGAFGKMLYQDSQFDHTATCTVDSNHYMTCTSDIPNILVPSGPNNDGHGVGTPFNGEQWVNGDSDALNLAVSLPSTAGNEYQGSTATITLTGHAVQFNNNNGGTGAPSNPGTGCPTTFVGSIQGPVAPTVGTFCPASWS